MERASDTVREEDKRMKVRRVVTGHRDGKAVLVSDEEVQPTEVQATTAAIQGSGEIYRLWGGDRAPTFPDDGSPPDQPTIFPPVGGYRFVILTLPPAGAQAPPAMEPKAAGMHTTDTIDFGVVLSGEIVLEVDDGTETTLHPGDTVVQNGTRHRWTNRGQDPAVLAAVLIGAHRSG
jgi:mannose-6-phosphate isomerase-like protein (cupin superfamily)